MTAGTNNSIVLTIDENGKPATTNGTWFEVPRSNLGDASFTLEEQSTTNFNNYGFSGWDLEGDADVNLATFFAIVVGTEEVAATEAITWNSISLVDGDIPTLPGAEDSATSLVRCQRYYEKSFAAGTLPATSVGVNTGEWIMSQSGADGTGQSTGTIPFKVIKRTATPAIITYNPASNNAQIRNETTGADCSAIAAGTSSDNGFSRHTNLATPTSPGNTLGVHWTADARLGIV